MRFRIKKAFPFFNRKAFLSQAVFFLPMLLHAARVVKNVQHRAGRGLQLCGIQHLLARVQLFVLSLQITIAKEGFVNLPRLLFGGLVV
jgi:hypothetical protein